MSRFFTVEATTPEGDIEMTGEAASGAPLAGVVEELVVDHANDKGFTPQDVTVTDSWWATS
jgi:hypothetical protein